MEITGVKLLIATGNRGKQQEWRALLARLPMTILLPDALQLDLDVAETGETYRENAYLKAQAFATASGLPALADDSGLEVDALDGAPGVRSARYRLGTDKVRYQALLDALEGVPQSQRTARFRCVAVLVLPDGRRFDTEGVCEGFITDAPAGELGFGYDPVFYIPQLQQTLAQLPQTVKNQISHRARAATAMRVILADIFSIASGLVK
ncbi:MAG: RdgB/HAM1 family non-canonical purine NTP pyrophosphatase [Anaerolineae bacterium]|nr:RdgB/HAM1 family non-canonical purine NTP pyrophosphatase [Anaerolineae bacterium]